MTRHCVVAGLVLGVSLLFQGWFIGAPPHGKAIDADYLQRVFLSTAYTQALARGHSRLLVEPDPRLHDALDPFAPEYRSYILSDASLYHDHYYLYFGIVPFVTLLVPWFKLTGSILMPGIVIIVFCGAGYMAYAGALLVGVRRWFSGCSPVATGAALAALIFASGTWPLMGRPAIYEIENASAFACLAWSLFFLTAAEANREKLQLGLMAAAGFAALSLGCRPNYFPAVSVIAASVCYRSWTSIHGARPRIVQILANLTPLIMIGVGLAWWNYHRFDNPLDFGLKHTVSADPSTARPLAAWSNLPYNLHRYILGSARLTRYFPFIQGTAPGPVHLGPFQEPENQVYGFLLISPILLAAAALFLGARSPARAGLGPLVAIAFAAFLGNFLFLCSVTMSCYRYPADFLGPLALVAAFGMLALYSVEGGWPRLVVRRLVLPAFLVWTGCALLFQLYSTAQTAMLLDLTRPADFAAAALPFNHAVYFLEHLRLDGPRAPSVTVRLPRNQFGHVEPLVVVGDIGARDFLYLNYVRPGVIQLGFESTGRGGLRSHYTSIDYDRPHRFELRYGSFLPPDDHPLLHGMTPADQALARRMITVLVDDEIVMDGWADFHFPRNNFSFGESPDDSAFGSKFSGQILNVDWPKLPARASPQRWEKAAYGSVRTTVELRPMPAGIFDPLLSLGEPGQGAQILIEHLAGPEVRLDWLDTHGGKIVGEPFAWPPGEAREVEVSAGSLLPPLTSSLWSPELSPAERQLKKRALRVVVGAYQALDAECESPDVSPATVVVGQDRLFLRAGVMPGLTGPFDSERRAPW